MALKRTGGRDPALADHFAALEAAENELPPLLTIHGASDFFRVEALRRFREAWLGRYPEGETITLRASGEARPLTFPDIAGELSGGSLFANVKLVIVRQAERLFFPTGGKGAAEETDEKGGKGKDKLFLEYLENPSPGVWLAVESSQLLKNRILGKKLAACCRLLPCPAPNAREMPGWLGTRARAAGKRLDREAAEILLAAYGPDPGVLASELDKLALYAPEAEAITAEAAKEFLTGTVEFDIFGYTNALEGRDAAAALYYARKIAVQGSRDQKGKHDDGERSAHRALAMAANSVQGMLRAGVAATEGKNASAFAAEEKLGPWRAEMLLAAARRFSLRELREMASAAADFVKRSHDTGGDARLAVELLAVKLAGRKR